MRAYMTYMERQAVSDDLHQRLLALEESAPAAEGTTREEIPRKRNFFGGRRFDFGALAACAVLFVGIGAGWLIAGPQKAPHGPDAVVPLQTAQPSAPMESENVLAVEPTLAPVESAPALDAADTGAFRLMENPDMCRSFYAMPALNFVDASGEREIAASIALPEGSFEVDLTLADLQKIFWGKDGKPETLEPDTELPWALYWGGCTVWARAVYDGEGDLWQLTVHGEREGDEFTLTVAPGHLPYQCVVLTDKEAATADVKGIAVTSWYQSYDRDGDGKDEVVCTSEFLVNGYGVRFQNVGAPQVTGETYDREASIYFNTLFVRQALDHGGLYLDDLAHNENIPNWRSQRYTTLGKARMEEEFAPYLPESAPYGGKGEFNSWLQYQEGKYNHMWVHWFKNYDSVEVAVYLPEGETGFDYRDKPVDVNVPESYDWRLYDIPICDNVPEKYQMSFSKPTFRAEDMSLEIVKARMHPHDTGGEICSFYVLHENGVVVGYTCSGVTAEYVWSLVEATLTAGAN